MWKPWQHTGFLLCKILPALFYFFFILFFFFLSLNKYFRLHGATMAKWMFVHWIAFRSGTQWKYITCMERIFVEFYNCSGIMDNSIKIIMHTRSHFYSIAAAASVIATKMTITTKKKLKRFIVHQIYSLISVHP